MPATVTRLSAQPAIVQIRRVDALIILLLILAATTTTTCLYAFTALLLLVERADKYTAIAPSSPAAAARSPLPRVRLCSWCAFALPPTRVRLCIHTRSNFQTSKGPPFRPVFHCGSHQGEGGKAKTTSQWTAPHEGQPLCAQSSTTSASMA
jgi:hypothetical protein